MINGEQATSDLHQSQPVLYSWNECHPAIYNVTCAHGIDFM